MYLWRSCALKYSWRGMLCNATMKYERWWLINYRAHSVSLLFVHIIYVYVNINVANRDPTEARFGRFQMENGASRVWKSRLLSFVIFWKTAKIINFADLPPHSTTFSLFATNIFFAIFNTRQLTAEREGERRKEKRVDTNKKVGSGKGRLDVVRIRDI